MRRSFWFGVIWILVLPLPLFSQPTAPPSSPAIQSESEKAPYIQYFSPALQGIVVERADGTDSRVIGKGLVPWWHDSVLGDGWSPSGRWFAWGSFKFQSENIPATQGFIVRSDNSRRLDLLDGLQGISQIEWSPVADILLVADQIDAIYPEPEATRFYLIDVENERVINAFTLDNGASAVWSTDGQYILAQSDWGYSNNLLEFSLMDIEGNITIEKLPYGSYVQWFDANHLLKIHATEQYLELIDTETLEVSLHVDTPFNEVSSVWLHPTTNHLLISTRSKELWYFDVEVEEWLFVSANFDRFLEYNEAQNALTFSSKMPVSSAYQYVFSSALYVFDFDSRSILFITDRLNQSLWSNEGRYIAYSRVASSQRTNGSTIYTLWLYDTEQNYAILIDDDAIILGYVFAEDAPSIFPPDDKYLIFKTLDGFSLWGIQSEELIAVDLGLANGARIFDIQWLGNTNQVIFSHDETYSYVPLYEYDFTIQQLSVVDEKTSFASVSPDGQSILFFGECAFSAETTPQSQRLCMRDLVNGTKRTLNIHSGFNDISFMQTFWHPSSRWAFNYIYDLNSSYSAYSYTIHSVDGDVSREVGGECIFYMDICMSWVPEDIDVDALMSAPMNTQTSPIALAHPGIVSAIDWSPDGTQLASAFSTYYYDESKVQGEAENSIYIWDVAQQEIIQTIPTPNAHISELVWSEEGAYLYATANRDLPDQNLVILRWSLAENRFVEIPPSEEWYSIYDIGLMTPDLKFDIMLTHHFDDTRTRSYHPDYYQIWVINEVLGNATSISISDRATAAPDGQSVIWLNNEDRTIHRLNLETYNETVISKLKIPFVPSRYGAENSQIALTDDERYMALGGVASNQVVIWDLETGSVVDKFLTSARDLDFSPDGKQIAAAGGYEVRIWTFDTHPLYPEGNVILP